MGCLAALSRFISCLGERGLPLYRLLRKVECFTWTPEAEEALGNLKALLTNVPILVPPAAGEALLIYIAATTQVVSAAIMVERRESAFIPFVSFGDLDNNTFKGLTSLLSVEQEIE
jgi:hypothetical protein